MRLFDRIINAFERRNLRAERDAIYRNDLDHVAAGRLVHIHIRLLELGDKPKASPPKMVEIVNDEATPEHHWHGYANTRPTMYHDAPEGLASQWNAPV